MASKLIIRIEDNIFPNQCDVLEVESEREGTRLTITRGLNGDENTFRDKASIVLDDETDILHLTSFLQRGAY